MIALDIETKSLDPDHPEYALQPWRVRSNEATVSLVGVGDGTKADIITLDALNRLAPSVLVGWNVLFDVAFLYAAGVDVSRHTWVDGLLLCKWVENCQANHLLGYSLVAAANRHLQDWPYLEQFNKLKKTEVSQSHDKYWLVRAKLDVMATSLLYDKLRTKLTDQQRKSSAIECGNILPNAMAWVEGIPTNPKYYTDPIPGLTKEMCEIECRLGVCNTGHETNPLTHWSPSKILRSPQQLAETLYTKWGLPCTMQTPKGAPATSKAALTYLADRDDKAIEILRWRHLNTRLTKFCQSPQKASEYLGTSTLHPEPKIFSTYTGRYTFGSKVGSHHIAMALHQIPRGPEVRRMVEAPEGKMLVEFDASGQEARLLAEIGNVESMLDVFRQGRKTHAVMGAAIAGIPYDAFMQRYKAGDASYAGPEGLYYCGKFVGLSMQYRVGLKKHRLMARVQYGLDKSVQTIQQWRALYHATYPEVQWYWQDAVHRAKQLGYAETLAGRRYYIDQWSKQDTWESESSAINFPIQGSGGDMKNLAITTLHQKFPELTFAWDLHDGVFYWADRTKAGLEMVKEANAVLNNLDYKDAWGWSPRIEMPWDCAIGITWGAMREL